MAYLDPQTCPLTRGGKKGVRNGTVRGGHLCPQTGVAVES